MIDLKAIEPNMEAISFHVRTGRRFPALDIVGVVSSNPTRQCQRSLLLMLSE
jgi:hypothetical protein